MMASIEQTPQFTSTPRITRRPQSLLDNLFEVSPILPVKGSKQRSKSLIPVSTCNTQQSISSRNKTKRDTIDVQKHSEDFLWKKLQTNAAKMVKSNLNLAESDPIKPTMTVKDGIRGMSLGLPTIPEHEQFSVSGMKAVSISRRPSSANILKNTNVGSKIQNDWQVPPETKNRFSLKNKSYHNPNEAVSYNAKHSVVTQEIKNCCEGEDDDSPLELCHSHKKRKVLMNDCNNKYQGKIISIDCEGSKKSLSNVDQLKKRSNSQQKNEKALTINNNQVCGLQQGDRQNNLDLQPDGSSSLNVRKGKDSSKILEKVSEYQFNNDDKNSLSSAALIKSAQKLAKEEDGLNVKETNNILSNGKHKLGKSKNVNTTKCRGLKPNLNLSSENNFVDAIVVDSSVENNLSKSLRSAKSRGLSEKTSDDKSQDGESTNKKVKKLPVKKPMLRKTCKVNSKDKKFLENSEVEVEIVAAQNIKTRGKKTSKMCVETTGSNYIYTEKSEENQLQHCTKEQESVEKNTNNQNINNLQKNITEEQIIMDTKNEEAKVKRKRTKLNDKCTETNKKEFDCHQGDIKLKVVGSVKSCEINNKTHIIVTDDKTDDEQKMINKTKCIVNTNRGILRNSTNTQINVNQAQKGKLKSIGESAEIIELNQAERLKICTNNEACSNAVNKTAGKKNIVKTSPLQENISKSRKLNVQNQLNEDVCPKNHKKSKQSKKYLHESKEKFEGDGNEKDTLQSKKCKLQKLSKAERSNQNIDCKDSKINQKECQSNYETNVAVNKNELNNEKERASQEKHEKITINKVENKSSSEEDIFEEKKTKSKSNENNATDRRLSSRKRRVPKDFWTNKPESDHKIPKTTKKKPIYPEEIDIAEEDTDETSALHGLEVSNARKCFGLSNGKMTMRDKVVMHTFVHINNYVMTGNLTLHPGDSITKSSTNTTYFVTSGSAKVRIGPVTRSISSQDPNCSFFIPKCSNFSIINEEEVPLNMYFTKFAD